MIIFRPLVPILLAALMLLGGCATNPMTGRSQLTLVSENSAIAQSAQAYGSMIGGLDKDGKISRDEALTARIGGITDKLITQAVRYRPETRNWAWSVKVIDDPKTVNAFCMAGGKMAIYTGFVEKLAPTDDEIAQVMGHEISHALAGHSAEKMSVQMASNIAVAAISMSSRNRSNRQSTHTAATLGALTLINLPNSREAENEADRLGVELAARAGYHPGAAVTLWQKMMKESGSRSDFDFLSTHPASPKRIEALETMQGPMLKIYQAALANPANRPGRAWTSLAPNVREVDPAQPDAGRQEDTAEAPLIFYTPEFESFREGRIELACTAECAAPFLLKQASLKALHESANWRLLAMETIKLGYRLDLTYYYLGRSARELGYLPAARIYLARALELAENSDAACEQGLLIGCGGIDVKQAARQALQAAAESLR